MSGIIGVGQDETSGVIGDFPAGHVLQVVSAGAKSGAKLTTTSQSYVEYSGTGTSVTITPSSTTSKVRVTAFGALVNTHYNKTIYVSLCRTSASNVLMNAGAYRDSTDTVTRSYISLEHLDSPSTVSAVTYKVFIKINQTQGSVIWGDGMNDEDENCTVITAQEIKG